MNVKEGAKKKQIELVETEKHQVGYITFLFGIGQKVRFCIEFWPCLLFYEYFFFNFSKNKNYIFFMLSYNL